MGVTTNIEWASRSWNPVTGCDKVSPGCAHCYAETFAERWRGVPGHPYEQGFDLKLWPARLRIPLTWRRPQSVFVNSMSDLFHEEIPFEFIDQVFETMRAADWHTFMVLTKRPERMAEYAQRWNPPLPNVWLGTTIENRRFVDRADWLRETPAAVRFISAEPLLGPLVPHLTNAAGYGSMWWQRDTLVNLDEDGLSLDGISWVIVGGESGPKHRPMRLEWVRDLRDVALDAGVSLFVKQLGGYRPGAKLEDLPVDLRIRERPAARTQAPERELVAAGERSRTATYDGGTR